MKIISSPAAFQREMEKLRLKGEAIGFVPTMGALHEGHLSLVKQAKKENDIAVVSIFVNPAQFGPKEDFKKYPRPVSQDNHLLKEVKTDYLFMPSAKSMYPSPSPRGRGRAELGEGEFSTLIEPPAYLVNLLCGKFRPGHFRGVATIVAKLFNLVKPHQAYLGLKDYQQARVISQMVSDLNMDIRLRLMPTVREKDGLAMSSRNRYLSAGDRRRAVIVSQVLFGIKNQLKTGEKDLTKLRQSGLKRLRKYTDSVDYLEIVDAQTLASLKKIQPEMVALAAVRIGNTRLIDNVIILTKFSS